jgi:hypothetical protein
MNKKVPEMWKLKHKKLRSAYRNLKTHTPYLFTFQDYPELKIPNTINSLDGFFTNLKSKLRIRQGNEQPRGKPRGILLI